MKANIMAHLVAGYPSQEDAMTVARALAAGGAAFLEIQFPFSDPTADGPVIQEACTQALDAGFKVDQGFAFVAALRKEFPTLPLYIMSYGSLVFTRGIKAFCDQAKSAGADGLIIPDLAPGSDEGLFAQGRASGLKIIPVIVPTVSPSRLEEILAVGPEYVYTAIRAGITGVKSEITPDLKSFLDHLSRRGVKVLAGFGIEKPDQVAALSGVCHALVVGSAFVREVKAHRGAGLSQALEAKMRELAGT